MLSHKLSVGQTLTQSTKVGQLIVLKSKPTSESVEGPTGTGNEKVEPVSMSWFFKKYIKYLNFNEKKYF
jgi:hypothetical protein